MTRVRIRGIYTTGLTRRLLDAGHEVVQASPPIRERFDVPLDAAPRDVWITDTDDRQGIGVSGPIDAVATVLDDLRPARDTFIWADPAPAGAVFDAYVTDALGSGAVVALDEPATPRLDSVPFHGINAEGFLPYDDADGYVDDGDQVRVQVHEAAPPWADRRPQVSTAIEIGGGLVSLARDRSDVRADVRGERGTELVRTTEMLPVDPPDGWGIRWERAAADAEISTLGDALDRTADRAKRLEDTLVDAPDTPEADTRIAAPNATAWCWFGRESRSELDVIRRDVTTTMSGHHRIKAGDRSASDAVDFVEAVCEPTGEFPFTAVADQFGPREGDRIGLGHGKPDGRLIQLGRGEVTAIDGDRVTLRRKMRSPGTYDALGTERVRGDVAITKLVEGRWWYPTIYRGEDGERKGTYVNICTPVELFPESARYVDLHVDVIKRPDGSVERVDEDELAAAVEAGHVTEALADKARSVAAAVENAL
ncbi:DUF402 domain-containing protein [Natranaeroarchaeum sulfidigenes]|uniref:Probable ribonuclease FAU-1 n=1 Tax=Natranaeroarchaeum sulfidigenes TaxID=2784880 RepID=A0A897MV95_9EURY|nr:DUF402 domain-containing protein [Natranaeroarchaeum sulfidigenes]QSG04201.1 Ribonuclease G and E [Natranaeroarchaeum sulfidigenes]